MSSCSASPGMGASKPRSVIRHFVFDLGEATNCTSSGMSDPIPPDGRMDARRGERFRVQRRLDPPHEYQRRRARAADGGSTSTRLQRRRRSLPEKVRAPSTKREEKSRFGSKTSFSLEFAESFAVPLPRPVPPVPGRISKWS